MEVEQFAVEKDDKGNLKRPYFDEVAVDVATHIRVARANGKTISLQEAYDRAVRANPATFEKLLAARDAEQKTKLETERKAQADAARKAAAANVDGEGAVNAGPSKTGDLRSDLERNYDSAEARV